MALLPGMLWKWVPGRAASFICLIFTPEHLLQVDAEESRAEGAVGAWVPRVKGATDTCKFSPSILFLQEPALLQSPWAIQGGNHA